MRSTSQYADQRTGLLPATQTLFETTRLLQLEDRTSPYGIGIEVRLPLFGDLGQSELRQVEQSPPQSRREQILRQSVELRRKEPCCRVRDVEVCIWLVSTQTHDEHGMDVITPVLSRGSQRRERSSDRVGEEPDQRLAFLASEQPIQRRHDARPHLLNIGA